MEFKVDHGVFQTWQHFCFTYEVLSSGSSGTSVKSSMYLQGEKVTEKTSTLTPEEYEDMPLDGALMLGQEQDKRGGGTDPSQGFSGELTQFNIWDRALTADEIFDMATCKGPSTNHVVLKLGFFDTSSPRVATFQIAD